MSKITTNANPLLVAFAGGAVASSVLITELESIVDVVTDCLHALPTTLDLPKERPGETAQLLSVAVATPEQKDQCFVRQVIYVPLPGF
jgi:hypothetical protein